MKVEYIPIENLKFSEYNPRALTEKEFIDLKESLLRFGFVEPIVVNSAPNRENVIIGGHQRVRVAGKIGIGEIPVVYVNISDLKKEQELNLRLNKNLGHWDYDLLVNFDENLLLEVGFEAEELDEIFGLDIAEEFDIQKELDKLLKGGARRVADGDIWQLGEHKLLIGDCTKKENWERLLGEERFDFMFTDPPYQIGANIGDKKIGSAKYNFKVKTKKGFGYKGLKEYEGLKERGGVPEYDEWLSAANEFQNPKGVNIMIFENWKNTVKLWQAIEKYWKIKNMIIWWLTNRCQGFSARNKFFSKYDIAQLAGNGIQNEEYEEELDNYLKEKGQKLLDTYEVILYGNQGKSYWDKKKGTRWARINDHITWSASTEKSGEQNIIFGTKPIQILVPYIKILSPRNGIVADPFCGSGSTIIAGEIMKRKCRAIEIEPIYGEVILNRFERFSGKKAVKLIN